MSHIPPPNDPSLIPPSQDGSANAAGDDAPPIFAGPASLLMGATTFFASGILAIIGAAAAIYSVLDKPSPPQMAHALLIGGAALFAASAIMPLYVTVAIRSRRYTITRRLIEREQGFFVKHVDAIDLAKVKDVELSQSLFERLFNVGTIKVFSADHTIPSLLIEAIPNPRPIYEQLRDAVIDIGRRRGVIALDR